MHPARRVTLRHLLMDDAAARGHPLDVSGGDGSMIPDAVGVLDASGEDVRDGFDPTVRVPRKTGPVLFRYVATEIIEQKKGVEV
jgi:hypothetical protein